MPYQPKSDTDHRVVKLSHRWFILHDLTRLLDKFDRLVPFFSFPSCISYEIGLMVVSNQEMRSPQVERDRNHELKAARRKPPRGRNLALSFQVGICPVLNCFGDVMQKSMRLTQQSRSSWSGKNDRRYGSGPATRSSSLAINFAVECLHAGIPITTLEFSARYACA